MKRIIMVLTVALVVAAMMVAMAMPAFADKGGRPHDPSCGVGTGSHFFIEDQTRPGASEVALPQNRPQEFNCPPPQQSD